MDKITDFPIIKRVSSPPKGNAIIPCPACKGAGYTRKNVPYGDPRFGKALMCTCKKEQLKTEQQQKLLELSGITHLKRFQNASFETFKSHLPGCYSAYRQAYNYAHNPDGWLLLLGLCGCGKTHLSLSIARVRVEQGDTVLFQTAPDLLHYLRGGIADHEYAERIEEIRTVNLLVLDDYGAQNATPWATESLFQLLNHRYNGNMSTVISCNDMTLETIDPRVRSRLHDSDLVTCVKMDKARDYRIYGDQV